jgi:deazaflavin-dependent oxidoreductase (nitroreductase family)
VWINRKDDTDMALLSPDHALQLLCYLTTTGRVTGKPHEIEIWFAQADGERDRIYMLSGGGRNRDWVLNLIASPAVSVRIDGATYPGTATPIDSHPEEPLARQLLAAKYQNWFPGQPLSDWATRSFPVAVDLAG